VSLTRCSAISSNNVGWRKPKKREAARSSRSTRRGDAPKRSRYPRHFSFSTRKSPHSSLKYGPELRAQRAEMVAKDLVAQLVAEHVLSCIIAFRSSFEPEGP
jgi:hypothetical protein